MSNFDMAKKKTRGFFSKASLMLAFAILSVENAFAAGPLTDLLKKSEVTTVLMAVGGIIALYQLGTILTDVIQGEWVKGLKGVLTVVGIIILFKYWGTLVDIIPL